MTRLAVRLGILALLSLVLPLASANLALGDIVVQYAFPTASAGPNSCPPVIPAERTGPAFAASTVDCGVTASDISIPDTTPDSDEAWIEDPPSGPMYGFNILRFQPANNGCDLATTPDDAVAKGRYFQFTVTADCGYFVDLDSLTFSVAKGGAADPRGYVVRADVDCYSSNIATADVLTTRNELTDVAINLSGDCRFQGLTEVTFRIYTYTPSNGQSVEYANVTANGTVVPACCPEDE